MSFIENLIPGFSAAKAVAIVAGAGAIFAAGMATDRFAPIIGAQHTIDSLNQAIGGYGVRMQADAAQMNADAKAITDRNSLLTTTQGTNSDETEEDAARCADQARTAYASGFLYGKSNGGQPAASGAVGAAGPGVVPPAGGLSVGSLADLWSVGRFTPAAPAGK